MKIEDVDQNKLLNGEYCYKGCSGCFCKVGWPYEEMCECCRDGRAQGDDRSFCVCPPKDENPELLKGGV